MKFERKIKSIKEKAENIFETKCIYIREYEEYTVSIGLILEIDPYCSLKVFINEKEIIIKVRNISTFIYDEVYEIKNIIYCIEKLIKEIEGKC